MSAASENLRNHQEQADMDGIMVKVSRQAVDEVLAEYDAMLATIRDTRALVSEGAMTGFNCKEGNWAERLFINQAKLSDAIIKATGSRR